MWLVAIVLDITDLKAKSHYTCFIVKYTSSDPKKVTFVFINTESFANLGKGT
jgi:hypothetical protein